MKRSGWFVLAALLTGGCRVVDTSSAGSAAQPLAPSTTVTKTTTTRTTTQTAPAGGTTTVVTSTPPSTTQASALLGTWATPGSQTGANQFTFQFLSDGTLTVLNDGHHAHGTYTTGASGASGTWSYDGGQTAASGSATFSLGTDGKTLTFAGPNGGVVTLYRQASAPGVPPAP